VKRSGAQRNERAALVCCAQAAAWDMAAAARVAVVRAALGKKEAAVAAASEAMEAVRVVGRGVSASHSWPPLALATPFRRVRRTPRLAAPLGLRGAVRCVYLEIPEPRFGSLNSKRQSFVGGRFRKLQTHRR
jgi:hypothetical protein